MTFTLKRTLNLSSAGAALLAACMAIPAQAGLKHRYTFNNGNANDSVGTAHGTIVDPGAPTAVFNAAGILDLTGNSGELSDNITNDAYLDLPNLIIENAANSGTAGALSLEWWFSVSTTRTWQRIGDFAGPLSNGQPSENVTNNGNVSYMLICANSGRLNDGIEISNDVGLATGFVGGNVLGLGAPASPALAPGVQHHVVATYDKTNTSAGPGGTMALYLNGVNILPGNPNVGGSNAIREDFNLNDLNDEDNWLGRSQWPDPLFDGSYNEFRIYDHAMSPEEVTASFTTGPVQVPLPTLFVNVLTGATAIRNLASGPIAIDYYEISSAAGRLNGAEGVWNSLSDQNLDAGAPADFDNSGGAVNSADLAAWRTAAAAGNANADADGDGDSDGNDFVLWQRQLGQGPGEGDSWDEAGGISDNLLVEAFLNGSSTMAANQQYNLGTPFRTRGVGDLKFQFALAGGGLTPGVVQYVNTGPAVAAPEPATWSLSALPLLGLAARRRRLAAKQRRGLAVASPPNK
jgi:hypothetical protein